MSHTNNFSMENLPISVKLRYYSTSPVNGGILLSKKDLKMRPETVKVDRFPYIIKTVLGTDKEVILKRKSRKKKRFVDLQTEDDFKAVEGALKVKNHIKLVVIDKDLVDKVDLKQLFEDKGFYEPELKAAAASKSSTIRVPVTTKEEVANTQPAETPLNTDIQGKLTEALMQSFSKFLDESFIQKIVDKLAGATEDINQAIKSINPTHTKGNFENSVHKNVICDNCHPPGSGGIELPITGARYHCVECFDVDLCEKCETSEINFGNHLSSHRMMKIKVPATNFSLIRDPPPYSCSRGVGVLPLQLYANHGPFSRGNQSTCLRYTRPSTRPPKPDLEKCSKSDAKPLYCRKYCDKCLKIINHQQNGHFSCKKCDFDLCEDCCSPKFKNNNTEHELTYAKALGKTDKPKALETHHFVYCDQCSVNKESIVGTRYKCMKCDDFDLCSACYEKGVAFGSHSPDHVMKIFPKQGVYSGFTKAKVTEEPPTQEFNCESCFEIGIFTQLKGKRYHCTECGFNMCTTCFENKAQSDTHKLSHEIRIMGEEENPVAEEDTIVTIDVPKGSHVGQTMMEAFSGGEASEKLLEIVLRADYIDKLGELLNVNDPKEIFYTLKQMIAASKDVKESKEVDSEPLLQSVYEDSIESHLTPVVEKLDIKEPLIDFNSVEDIKKEIIAQPFVAPHVYNCFPSVQLAQVDGSSEESIEDNTGDLFGQPISVKLAEELVEKHEPQAESESDSKPVEEKESIEEFTGDSFGQPAPVDASTEKLSELSEKAEEPAKSISSESTSLIILPTLMKESAIFVDAESNLTGEAKAKAEKKEEVEAEQPEIHEVDYDVVSSNWDSDVENISEGYEILDSDFEN